MATQAKKKGTNSPKGTNRADDWTGSAGNDTFNGLAGDDTCDGGNGNDNVDGGTGNDEIDGGAGNDLLAGGAGLGNDEIDGGRGGDTIEGGAGNDLLAGGAGDDDIDGGAGNDTIRGGAGNDTIVSSSGKDRVTGDAGDDNIDGGSGNDQLAGGAGNDVIAGGTGKDRVLGGAGDDILVWNSGDGNDTLSGNDGLDTVQINGASATDNFVLKDATGGSTLTIGQFNLTADTVELFDIKGAGGNDILDARGSSVRVLAAGGDGDDVLIGGTGTVVGANNAVLGDTLTGGAGKDKFQFSTNPFANGNPAQNLNQPDVITDYEIGQDQIVLDKQQTGINALNFQKGGVNQLSGGANLLVLEGTFANAGAAASAIRDNPNLTAGKGAFVYFNSTLGFSRVVFSNDLANGGTFSVLGNLTNQTNPANQANFSAADFSLV
ncbi:hypothetical protein IFO70_22490 [Phormidium tenue FACHB-886]|nr:hypothetical protein [Phormidium tenue FACHB-886]